MKYLIVALLGLIIGAAAGGAALYYNPLTDAIVPAADTADRTLQYSLPDRAFELSIGANALPLGGSSGDNALWEETIAKSALLGIVLDDSAGKPAAVASRLIAGAAETDLLLRGVLLHDYWLLTFPGEGTVFVEVDTNVWPFLKQTFVPVWYLGRPWNGPTEFRPTAGPGAGGAAVVIGATGRFAGVEGSALERYRVTRLDRTTHTAAAAGELHLNLPEPQVAGETPPAAATR